MNIGALEALAAEWRQDASVLRRRGAVGQAEAAESFAAELETRLREWQLEALTLEEAALESGYGYSALQKKVANGQLANVGTKGRPRIRRADLPHKGVRPEGPDLAAAILQ